MELRRTPIPIKNLNNNKVLVRALASGISQGTEMLLYSGEGPQPFDPSLDSQGAPTYPRRYGYAWIGEVEQSGPAARIQPGQRVFTLAPHGDYHCLPESELRLLPNNLPSERAVLCANMETAITCVWDSKMGLGDSVVVLGGGIVGLLIVALAHRAGARVLLVEPIEKRRNLGKILGADESVSPERDRPRGDADIVIAATGNPIELDRAIGHAGQEARIIVASFYGQRRFPVDLGSDFHRKRLRIISSQVSSIPSERAARWNISRRFELGVSMLGNEIFNSMIDAPIPFESAPELYKQMYNEPGNTLQSIFSYA